MQCMVLQPKSRAANAEIAAKVFEHATCSHYSISILHIAGTRAYSTHAHAPREITIVTREGGNNNKRKSQKLTVDDENGKIDLGQMQTDARAIWYIEARVHSSERKWEGGRQSTRGREVESELITGILDGRRKKWCAYFRNHNFKLLHWVKLVGICEFAE